jgi:hypothetical protein
MMLLMISRVADPIVSIGISFPWPFEVSDMFRND